MSNARLAILVLLGAEMMLFSGLIGTFLVFRVGNVTWPPPSHIGIELPRAVTGINTVLLLLSGYTMFQARRAIQKDSVKQLRNWLLLTGGLGLLFLGVQGSEWVQLIRNGLTLPIWGVWWHLLCTHRVPCRSRTQCCYLAIYSFWDGDGRSFLSRTVRRHRYMYDLLDFCCRALADSLRFGVSFIKELLECIDCSYGHPS